MLLKSIKYSEYDEQTKEWTLDNLELNPINLIVGKNASGKTRTLNLVNNLALLIRGERLVGLNPTNISNANYDVCLTIDNSEYNYEVSITNGVVVKEILKANSQLFLDRELNKTTQIRAEQLNQSINIQIPPTTLAVHVRRDTIQHPFFEPMYKWASSVFHYAFGTHLGRETYGIKVKEEINFDPRNTSIVVPIFNDGDKKFGTKFKQAIRNDLEKIGYVISDIGIAVPSNIIHNTGTELSGLWVQESDLKDRTEQGDISQGMFRALSLIIQLNYSIMALEPTCILIDDIGEGLDYERSCALITLLLEKIKGSNTQLLMTTNDRFIMNSVPLEMWTVLYRDGSHCKAKNIHNAKEQFENFRFTGLNNFDFFATDYLNSTEK